MTVPLLLIFHYALLLLYGIMLSFAFAGVERTRRNAAVIIGLFAGCGLVQLALMVLIDEGFVWRIYPIVCHAPIVALLCLMYSKRLLTALAAVATAYLCCQPANWAGVLVDALTGSFTAAQAAEIATLVALGYFVLRYATGGLAGIYNKDGRSVLVFAIVPFVYYVFDYSMSVYSEIMRDYAGPAVEFLPCFLCLAFVTFCVTYYKTYEQQMEGERREQIINITVEQQKREVEAMRRSEAEVRILRHDMRLLLNNLMQALNEGDVPSAKRLIEGHITGIDKTVVRRFCESDIINYVISDFSARCAKAGIRFEPDIRMGEAAVDEMLLASLMSNALDNAVNAQVGHPAQERLIAMSLMTANGRLLLKLSNAYAKRPEFVDGIPVSHEAGHGIGTQSIRYMAERLGGNCKFSLEGELFVLRVAIEL